MAVYFQQDWKDEDGNTRAIPHITTTNDSFLRMAGVLKAMGIKNYYFHLALLDPDLEGVDPHKLQDDNPRNELLRRKVLIECRRNIWYFLREVVRIYDQGGDPIPFMLSRGSLAMTWSFMNGIDYWSMQPRQAQPLDAMVKTPNGFVPMGSLAEADWISMPDGGKTKIKMIQPHGVKDVYRITLADGRYTECCLDHLWRVYNDQRSWSILSLDQFIENYAGMYIPVSDGRDGMTPTLIKSIEYVDSKPVQCISIDHPDHLYITDDHIVSHNTGKTVCAITLSAWVMYIGARTFTMGMMAKDNNLRLENLDRVKKIRDYLPKWFTVPDRYHDKDNATMLYYHKLNTKYNTLVAQESISSAEQQGRGASFSMLHIDEIAYCSNIKITYSAAMSSTDTARANARKNGQPHANILTTTAGDPSEQRAREALEILTGSMTFTEHLYDLKDHATLHTVVKANSPQKMLNGTFSHLQLGKTNEWLREIIARNKLSADRVARDYLNRWVSIQTKPIIPKDILARINSSQREQTHIQMINSKFVVYWYIPKERVESDAFKNVPFVLGCDSSEMIGRDYTTLVGIDPRDGSTVCTWCCNEGSIPIVGASIAQFMLMYPKAILMPENKSSGTSLIDIVAMILKQNGVNPFLRIFNWIVNNKNEEPFCNIDYRNTSLIETTAKKFFGFKTDKSKREELYTETLLKAAEIGADNVRDQGLINELNNLTTKNGRVDHGENGHDDRTIAWLLAWWMIRSGRNLDVYGIRPGSALSKINPSHPEENVLSQQHQDQIRSNIAHLEEGLKAQKDPALRRLLESDIALWTKMLGKQHTLLANTTDDIMRDPSKFVDKTSIYRTHPSATAADIVSSARSFMVPSR